MLTPSLAMAHNLKECGLQAEQLMPYISAVTVAGACRETDGGLPCRSEASVYLAEVTSILKYVPFLVAFCCLAQGDLPLLRARKFECLNFPSLSRKLQSARPWSTAALMHDRVTVWVLLSF